MGENEYKEDRSLFDCFYNYGNDNEHSFPDIGDLSNDNRREALEKEC